MAALAFWVGAGVFCAPGLARAEAPERVVSINLCTDQLAMMLAGEGQLISVSRLSLDPNVSALVDQARSYRINTGLAEDVFLMQPDLVLAGVYTPQATVSMLRNLGIPVEIFDITESLDGVRDQVAKMGHVLHRDAAADRVIADFDARRAALASEGGERPSAILFYANGYTSGEASLAHEILELGGFRNAAVEAGYVWGMKMPLEVLAMTEADLVITPTPYPGGSRAEDVTRHPAVKAMQDQRAATTLTNQDWICGTPFVLRAAERLAATRRTMVEADQ